MRRPRFRRSSSSRYSRHSTPEYMMSIPQSPTQMSLRHRDTGFPESFCGSRNTTLPHPEANTSPDACITEDDVSPARAMMRYRMSFMAQQQEAVDGRSSTLQKLGLSSSGEGGTLSAFSRLAMNSLRAAELPGLDTFLSSGKDSDSVKSSDGDGMSSSDPDSPLHRGKEFDPPTTKVDPRGGAVQDPREGRRRRGSIMRRLVHR